MLLFILYTSVTIIFICVKVAHGNATPFTMEVPHRLAMGNQVPPSSAKLSQVQTRVPANHLAPAVNQCKSISNHVLYVWRVA